MARRGKGEGSLYQAKDKSWIYQYTVNGTRRTKRFGRKSDANLFIRQLAAEDGTVGAEPEQLTEQTTLPMPEPAPVQVRQKKEPQKKTEPELTVGEWLDRWLEKYARPTVKLSTYCSYELYIRAHIKPQIGA